MGSESVKKSPSKQIQATNHFKFIPAPAHTDSSKNWLFEGSMQEKNLWSFGVVRFFFEVKCFSGIEPPQKKTAIFFTAYKKQAPDKSPRLQTEGIWKSHGGCVFLPEVSRVADSTIVP